MRISKNAKREAKALFRACQVNGLLDERRALETVRLVVAQKPRGYAGVLRHFQHLVQLDVARHTARVESATELPNDLRTGVAANLAKAYGPGLNLTYSQNPALIGGLRVAVGFDVYDGSVQGRLAALEEMF
jgi:F-type H+-transporting ATPase subunit delta